MVIADAGEGSRRRSCLADLARGDATVWLRPAIARRDELRGLIALSDIDEAADRMARFVPALARLFAADGWDGRIRSDLLDHANGLFVKGDHALPMTGSVKARGGVHELLCFVEDIATACGLAIDPDVLTGPDARAIFAKHAVVVASTGNLGYSIGLVSRAFGLAAEIHMSHDAKAWKKARLRALGAVVVEHAADYSDTVALARAAAERRSGALFVDDERSRRLFCGYAAAARELAEQLDGRGIAIGPDRRLVVYLPCGVGGAPGGITLGLKAIFGENVICVVVEPVASACMLVALAAGGDPAPSVYEFGCDNRTIADGLAVARASDLVIAAVGNVIDGAVAVTDAMMIEQVRQAWHVGGLRLEPSAAAALAAPEPFRRAARESQWPGLDGAIHVAWATGGSHLPDEEFFSVIGTATA